jgi:hypothetical protein
MVRSTRVGILHAFDILCTDAYGRGARNRYDDGRRSPRRRYSPDSRYRKEPNLPHPMDQERLVPYRSFVEWYRDADPDQYAEDEVASREKPDDRTVGLKARYDEFRADFNAKQVSLGNVANEPLVI